MNITIDLPDNKPCPFCGECRIDRIKASGGYIGPMKTIDLGNGWVRVVPDPDNEAA